MKSMMTSLAAALALHAAIASAAAPARIPEPGLPWFSPSSRMEFVWIEALDLWVGKFEVTNGQYRRFRPAHDSGRFQTHSLNSVHQPAVEVGFQDAIAFAAWLNQQDARVLGDLRYRLPSEDEWQTYAQCGDSRAYPWGDRMPPRFGNYHGREGAETWDKITDYNDTHPVSAPVDDSGENGWGLFGVGGNVWELTASPSRNTFSAWRGASWADGVDFTLRCDTRDDGSGSSACVNGFRLVLAPTYSPPPPADPDPDLHDSYLVYTIQPGDTWEGIARLFVVPREDLLRANRDDGIDDPAPDRRIYIPPCTE